MNIKIITFTLFVVGSILLLSGCANTTESSNIIYGTGEMVSRSLQVEDFTELEVGGGSSFTVIFRQSDYTAVNVEMQENLFDLHEISVEGDTLSLVRVSDDRIIYGNYRPKVYIYTPNLTAINVGGALHAEDWDTIRTQNFSITSNGFVRISAHLEVDTLELNLSGASELEFWGDAHNATIIKNGAGNIFAGSLQTSDTTITLNGSGEIEIAVSNTLDATLEGVGNIRYIGNPTITQFIGRTAVGSIGRVE